jgi:hypothetical protein
MKNEEVAEWLYVRWKSMNNIFFYIVGAESSP